MPNLALKPLTAISPGIPGTETWHANPSDPAVTVMTDFRSRASVTVAATMSIDAALEHMKHAGVRCAFAIDEARRVVVGLITAYDISSEKPMRLLPAVGGRRDDVLVKDLMQPVAEWRALDFHDLEGASVAAVARVFEESQLTHIPVFESNGKGEQSLRGLLSAARIKRLLAR